jgi:beta-glucosidase
MQPYQDKTRPPIERARDLCSLLTLNEKVGQLNQRLHGFLSYIRTGGEIEPSEEFMEEVRRFGGLGTLYGLYRADPWSQRNFETGLDGKLAVKAYNLLQNYVIRHSRFQIPMLVSSECPHGHQALSGYLLPVNLAAGATFRPELLEKAVEVCGKQLRELHVNLALVSMLDILRDPRWGRSEECYGEDPYLASRFAKAAIRGIQSQGVAVAAKHFCAQGETTGGINASAARIGMRELR